MADSDADRRASFAAYELAGLQNAARYQTASRQAKLPKWETPSPSRRFMTSPQSMFFLPQSPDDMRERIRRKSRLRAASLKTPP